MPMWLGLIVSVGKLSKLSKEFEQSEDVVGMKVMCAHDELIDIATLVPNPRNPNKHPDAQIKLLAKIMKHQGWRSPVVVSNRSGFIVKGHGRMEAAKLNGWDLAPVDRQDYANEADEYADMVADNKIAELSDTDLSMVLTDVLDLGPDFDFDLLGIPDFKLPDEEFEVQADEDEVPEHVEPKTKPGDIYHLGRHRLMCGDSTSIDAVERLMDGAKADMVFTDPPYGMKLDADYSGMGGTGKKHRNITGDHDDFTPELINTIFASAPDAKECFTWGADYYCEHLPNKNEGSWIVWDKRSNENEVGKMDGQFGSAFELCWSRERHKRDICRLSRPTSFWRGDEKSVHPTQKPIGVIEWFFDQWGDETTTVLDLFGGSGSTLIACEKTDRSCFMMELDPHYCDVIVARWEKYTGKQAELINGET